MPFTLRGRWWSLIGLAGAIGIVLWFAGPARAASALTASPPAGNFPGGDIHGAPGPNETFQITNPTDGPVTINDVEITGLQANQFSLGPDFCQGVGLNPADKCDVTVMFHPSSKGAKSATLELTDSDGGTLDVMLTGAGMTGTLTANPDPVVFNPQPYFFGSQTQNINIQNSPDFSTQASSLAIVGSDAGQFSIAYGQNCATAFFFPNGGNSCGMGIQFNPPGPGTFHAELAVVSDSDSSPLVVPIEATALHGPTEDVSPRQTDFGDVEIGKSVARTITIANHGDYPLQIQQAFMVTGTPSNFPITGDRCSGQNVAPGSSCSFTVSFQPSAAGFRDGAVIVITNTPQPVSPIGFTGTGLASPRGAAVVTGPAAAGSTLACHPTGYDPGTGFVYQWLRDGAQVAGATGASFTPGDGDVGTRLACRVTAVNSVGNQTVTSPATGPVAATDLSRLPGSFVDRRGCRTVGLAHRLSVGSTTVAVKYSQPTVLWAPLTLSATRALTVALDGQQVGRGQRVTVSPRALSGLANGSHVLVVGAGGASVSAPLLLGSCQLAVRVQGGQDRAASIAVSASAALGDTTITLPRGLTLHPGHHMLGQFSYTQSGYPTLGFPLIGRRSSANDITVTLTGHRIRVTNLPARTGVIRLSLRSRVLTGSGGVVRAAAAIAGTPGTRSASGLAVWSRARSSR